MREGSGVEVHSFMWFARFSTLLMYFSEAPLAVVLERLVQLDVERLCHRGERMEVAREAEQAATMLPVRTFSLITGFFYDLFEVCGARAFSCSWRDGFYPDFF